MKSIRLNNCGMGLVEVMMVVTIMTILTMGVSSLVLGAFGKQKQANLTQTLTVLRERLQNSIMSDPAWRMTITDPAFGCFPAAACAAGNQTFDTLYTVDDAGAVVIWYDTSVATAGFDINGQACNTFSDVAGAGDNNCPIRYTMTWTPMCNGAPCGAATVEPDIRVNFTLVFNPADAGQFVQINPEHYNLQISRQKITNQIRVVLSENIATNNANAGTGACGNERNINTEDDPFHLATIVGVNGRFTLVAGTYQCRIRVPAYSAGSFSATLRDVTNARNIAFASGSTSVPNGNLWSGRTQSEATIMANFKIFAVTTFQIIFNCESSHAQAAGRPVIDSAGGGWPSTTELTRLECQRSD